MGDESTSPTSAAPPSAVQQQTTQDLLADIFGSSDTSSTPAATSPTAPSSNVNDIMSLFGSTSLSPQPTGYASPTAAAPTPSNDLFSTLASTPAAAAPQPPAAAPAPSAPQPREAYNGNGLKITLTPIRDSNNRNVVNILAKFTSTQPVQAVNFQAAVPKVSFSPISSMATSK
jgi:AP-1 complex subunit gamma-1